MQSAEAVANYFIEQARQSGCGNLTQMKLQKLAYFAHGWHLGLKDEELFSEPIQAWTCGPVIYSLYREFKEFGNARIDRKARDLEVVEGELREIEPELHHPDEWLTRFLARIWSVYGSYTPIQLSNMTHEPGTPWDQVNQMYEPRRIPRGLTIPNEMIRKYFRQMVQEQRIT